MVVVYVKSVNLPLFPVHFNFPTNLTGSRFLCRGGVQPGDVISQINGKVVTTATDVYRAVEENQELNITVLRGKKTLVLKVLPEEI